MPYPTDTPEGAAAERSRRAAITTIAFLLARATALGAQLLVIRWLIGALGTLQYGLWAAAVSGVSLLWFMQLGMSPSLQNALSRADTSAAWRAERTGTALVIQFAIAVAGSLAVLLLAPRIDWHSLFNVPPVARAQIGPELSNICVILALALLWRFPLSVPTAIARAEQKGYLEAVIQIIGTLVTTAAIYAATRTTAGLTRVALVHQGVPLLILALGGVMILRRSSARPSPAHVTLAAARELLGTGRSFLVVGVAAYFIANVDNLVVAHFAGVRQVATYTVTFFVTQLMIQLVFLLLDVAWPRWTEAASRRDVRWLRENYRQVTSVSRLILVTGCAIVLIAGRSLIGWWAGPDAIPSFALLSSIVFMTLVQGFFLPVDRLVTALGAVSVNAKAGMLNAGINLVASILLARLIGSPGVALGTAIGYLVVGWMMFPIAKKLVAELES